MTTKAEYYKNYYKNNKETITKRNKLYYKLNKKKYSDYYIDNKDDLLKKSKKYYEQNKNNYKIYYKKYYKEKTRKKYYNDFDYNCRHKINVHKRVDIKKKRSFDPLEYVTVEWVKEKLTKNNNICYYCKKELKLVNFEKYSKDQYSIDRRYGGNMPHIKNNCVICCSGCNLKKNRCNYIDFMKTLVK